jgi:hypothetical protein
VTYTQSLALAVVLHLLTVNVHLFVPDVTFGTTWTLLKPTHLSGFVPACSWAYRYIQYILDTPVMPVLLPRFIR